MTYNKRQIGTEKEKLAGAYLEKNGYEIIEYNFRCRQGEIDIVAKDGNYLVFTEVKFRSTTRLGSALEAVNYKKQCRICKVADYYRYKHRSGFRAPAYPSGKQKQPYRRGCSWSTLL